MSSYNDDQFGFQNSLNGKKEDWVVGRKRRLDYGGEWLDLYQLIPFVQWSDLTEYEKEDYKVWDSDVKDGYLVWEKISYNRDSIFDEYDEIVNGGEVKIEPYFRINKPITDKQHKAIFNLSKAGFFSKDLSRTNHKSKESLDKAISNLNKFQASNLITNAIKRHEEQEMYFDEDDDRKWGN